MLFLNNCTVNKKFINQKLDYGRIVEEYNVCRGKGTLISAGTIGGKLSFTYTCTGEDVFIHFKDMLGRRTMLMVVRPNSVEAWDMMKNIRFTTESIYLRFPFFEVIKPQDLVHIFWGIEPLELNKARSIDKHTGSAIAIKFSGDGSALQTVFINMDERRQTIELTFDEREFGSSYPHLIKQIPESTPQAQS